MIMSDLPIYDGGPNCPPLAGPQDLYLDLLARDLTGWDHRDPAFDPEIRSVGRDHPPGAETMVGLRRLANVRACVVDVISKGVPGDLIEAGVWRGGVAIYMRGLLEVLGDRSRTVWAADSFAGLPKPDVARFPADEGDLFWTDENLAVSVEQVKMNFRRYGLLDDRVKFLEGWFADTLAAAPIERLSVMRLDGDMYGSTIDALTALYPRLSVGGYSIIDDYGCVPACKLAVDDYRRQHGIHDPLHTVDWTGVYWRRT